MSITEASNCRRLGPLATLIFSSRWLQLPLYLGLIVAQGFYLIHFILSAIGIAWTDRTMLAQSAGKTAKY